jgi:hypothetical protein
MKFAQLAWMAAAVIAFSDVSSAQQAENAVRQAIDDAIAGKCSDVLSITVKFQCQKTLPAIKERMKQLGALKSVTFQGMDQAPNGVPVEVYLADHAQGQIQWLAKVGPDGKLIIFWSAG